MGTDEMSVLERLRAKSAKGKIESEPAKGEIEKSDDRICPGCSDTEWWSDSRGVVRCFLCSKPPAWGLVRDHWYFDTERNQKWVVTEKGIRCTRVN